MLSVSLESDKLTEKNRVTMEQVEISETDSFLRDSIHFHLGDWFQPTIQITEVSLDSPNLTKYQSISPSNEADMISKPENPLSKRTLGTVNLNLCLSPYSLSSEKIENSLTLYHIPVQIGIIEQKSRVINIYLRPRDIYDNLNGRFQILSKINTNNKNSSIIDEDFETIIKDYEHLVSKIHQIINLRISRVYG